MLFRISIPGMDNGRCEFEKGCATKEMLLLQKMERDAKVEGRGREEEGFIKEGGKEDYEGCEGNATK